MYVCMYVCMFIVCSNNFDIFCSGDDVNNYFQGHSLIGCFPHNCYIRYSYDCKHLYFN